MEHGRCSAGTAAAGGDAAVWVRGSEVEITRTLIAGVVRVDATAVTGAA